MLSVGLTATDAGENREPVPDFGTAFRERWQRSPASRAIDACRTGCGRAMKPAMPRYDDLSKDDLIRLLQARDRRDATRFGLVWEANEIERDKALNADFVALDPDPALSCGEAPWRNLIIEGDNFDALRALRMAYAGRVKCICIDPPYNTGNRDFVYNDRFVDREDRWRHSRWCEFMYQRLVLAKELLAEDGVIFVHIDDNEIAALRLLMNLVFGEQAFVANCVWQKRYSRENREAIGDAHEYVVVYSPGPEKFKEQRGKIPLTEDQAKIYRNPNNDPRGRWRTIPITAQSGHATKAQFYTITGPTGKCFDPPPGNCWRYTEPAYEHLKAQGRIYFGKDGNSQPTTIRYLDEVDGLVPWTWWPHEEVGHTDESKKELLSIFGKDTAFDTPKPVRLLERILQIGCGPDDIVLDFFAGSGTTAHAVLKQNAADGGRRRFILVSSTEATEEEPGKNLCRDVCAERVRRVIAGYGDHAGLPGNFAYLRCRRIAEGEMTEIEHGEVWTALQLIHREALDPYEEAALHWTEDDDGALCYVPRVQSGTGKEILKRAKGRSEVMVYTWQPGLLRPRLAAAGNVQVEAIPQSLAKRFGLNTGAA